MLETINPVEKKNQNLSKNKFVLLVWLQNLGQWFNKSSIALFRVTVNKLILPGWSPTFTERIRHYNKYIHVGEEEVEEEDEKEEAFYHKHAFLQVWCQQFPLPLLLNHPV